MPIPKPKEGESEQDFIPRCIRSIIDEYDQNQALGICYSQLRQKMSESEEKFVLTPRKNENRGAFLTRCSRNSKMKAQAPNLKERMADCLNAFNAYYKYWAKIEEFGDIPKDSVLGMCITKEKARGLGYQEAYARCATKSVSPSGTISFQDDLIEEPVIFEGPTSIDFDDTLSTKRGQELAKKLLDSGVDLHIVTRRNRNDSGEVYKIAKEVGIPESKIHFTNGELKWKTLEELGITKHIDNNPDEISAIEENTDIEAVKFKKI